MKKMFLLFAVLFSSSAFSHMNLGSVNNQLEFKGEYNPPQSEQDQRWTNYNPTPNNPAPPAPPVTGLDKVRLINGSACSSKNCWAYAQCPSGTRLVSGGWRLTEYSGGTGFHAPHTSRPNPSANRWELFRGGMNEHRGYQAYAMCASR